MSTLFMTLLLVNYFYFYCFFFLLCCCFFFHIFLIFFVHFFLFRFVLPSLIVIKDCFNIFQVEIWLNRVMDSSRATVRQQQSEAVVSYEEKPRDQWLFDFPAQVALCGTQIWWTTEVGISFARLEEGYENALKDYYKKQVPILV